MRQIKDIGEFRLIERITRPPHDTDTVVVGIGDDAAVLKTTDGLQVATTDCLVEGDHFRRDWFTPFQIGRKAIESNVSDIAAMGGIPRYVLVSLALPRTLDVAFVEQLYEGMWKSCDNYSLDIVGGNMTHAEAIMISLTVLGIVDDQCLCLRSDAQPGDAIGVIGSLGYGGAGLRVLQEHLKGYDPVVKRYLEPQAYLAEARKCAPVVHAMIDVSDGLASEVGHICRASCCGARLFQDKIPLDKEILSVGEALNEDPYGYIMYGGEDFSLVFTAPEQVVHQCGGVVIGEITKGKKLYLSSRDSEQILQGRGYDHFQR